MSQEAQAFEAQIVKKVGLKYLLYLPKGYRPGGTKTWPLIVFLHGMGERGDNLEDIKKHGLTRLLEAGGQPKEFPFIVVSPQCPLGTFWTHELDALNALVDHAIRQYRVDTTRIYLTGLSMGGYGTWFLAMAYPERFAAIAPVCGGGNPGSAAVIKDLPIWVFHGAKDRIVRPAESRMMVKALKAVGSGVKLTIYPEAEHDSWTPTYNNPELYTWFLEHSR